MNSSTENSSLGIPPPECLPGLGEMRRYSPVAAAVSYAQSLSIAVPCMLRTSESGRCMVVHELPYALRVLDQAAISVGLAADLDPDRVVSKIAAAMSSRAPHQQTWELIIAVDNLASDFAGNDCAVSVSLRGTTAGQTGVRCPVRYSLCRRSLGVRQGVMSAQLSSYSAELRFAAMENDTEADEIPIHFDSDGYLLGPEDGVLVAVTERGIHCMSVSRPVLVHGTARRLGACGYRIVAGPLHLSELVEVSGLGWVGNDFRLFEATLLRHERGMSVDALPDYLASVPMQDDILIPTLLEV